MSQLYQKKILVFGLGGVGGIATEALVRTGIGTIGIVDFDYVDETNINRQILALHSTVGKPKTHVMERRVKDINPDIEVKVFESRLTADNLKEYRLEDWDYIVDAIDDVPAKVLLIKEAKYLGIPIISSMGTGNKLEPSMLQVTDIYKTHTCPLAKTIRKKARELGIKELKVIFSTEEPHREEYPDDGNHAPASIAFVPASAGLMLATEVVKDLIFIYK